MWVDQLWITIAQSPTNQKHGCTLDAWYSLKPWGILTEAPFPPFSRHINTSRVCSMLGHQHVLKKKNIPFDAINPFLRATILEAYPTKSQKVDSSKNPAQFVVAVFLIFSKKKKLCSKGNLSTKSSHRFHYQVTELGFEDSEGSDFWRRAPDVWGSLKTPTRSPPGKSR